MALKNPHLARDGSSVCGGGDCHVWALLCKPQPVPSVGGRRQAQLLLDTNKMKECWWITNQNTTG
jgi:hypothetical protein